MGTESKGAEPLELRIGRLVDPVEYRIAAAKLRSADPTSRGRWWSTLAMWDILRLLEADSDGIVPVSGSELAEIYGLASTTWPDWFKMLEAAGLVEQREVGWKVEPLRLVEPGAVRGRGRLDPVAIDPIRYRIHVLRLRKIDQDGDHAGRRWWPALGAWGLMRMVDADNSSRVLPYTRHQLAQQWDAHPSSFSSWIDLLLAAGLMTELDGGGFRMALLRGRRPGLRPSGD